MGSIVLIFFNLALIGLAIMFALMIRFTQYIEIFDAVIVAVFVWLCSMVFFSINGWIGFVIGLVFAGIFYAIFKTKYGFWLMTVFFSWLWAYIFGSMAKSFSDGDPIAFWVVGILAFALCFNWHLFVLRRKEINDAIAMEDSQRYY